MKVLVADGSQVVVERMLTLMREIPNVEPLTPAYHAQAALDSMRANDPELLIVDMRIPGAKEMDLLPTIRREKPKAILIILSNLSATVSITDTLGDTFSQVAQQAVTGDHDSDLLVGTAKTTGPNTITVNAGTGKNVYAFSIHEYSGVTAVVDVSATAQGKGSALASGSVTTVNANDLVFAWFTNSSSQFNEYFTTLGSPYTKREMSGTGTAQCFSYSNCIESGDLVTTATLTTNATASLNVSDAEGWSATVVAFKAASPIAFAQSASTSQSNGNAGSQTESKAFSKSVTSGNLLIVGVFVDPGATVSVTDSLGDTFSQVAHQTVTGDHDADVLVGTAKATGANTITVNAGSGKNVYAFSIHEYSGVTAVVDASATAQGNSTAPASGSLTTANANDLIFAWFTNSSDFANENFSALNSGYTKREMSGSGTTQCFSYTNCLESGDLIASAALTTNATATLNVSDSWSATVVAFKGAASTVAVAPPVNTAPAAGVSPTSLAFASQTIGSASAARTVTLTNSGNASLTLTGIAVTGANAGDFTETSSCGSSLAAGANCTISIIFKPTASGARSAAVTLTDNAAGNTQTVSLSGTGASTASAAASLSPSSLTFVSQTVGAASAAQSVTLTNTGSAALTLTGIALTGANVGDFAETNSCGSSVAAGAKCTISVTFKPTASGARSAAVTLTDNAAGSTQTVSLSGTGTSGAAATLSLSSTNLAFGSQPVDMTSSAQTVTLTNTGTTTLSLTSLVVTGANSSDYEETGTCGSSIAAGSNCTIAVMFTPGAAGARTAAVSIADNATGSPQSVSLAGTGSHDVILAWAASPTSGVVGYYVYRGTTSGGESLTPINSVPVTSTTYTDATVTAGATYYYVVAAIGSNGATSSDSNQAAATVPTP